MLADIIHKVAAIEYDNDRPYHPRPSLASPEIEDNPGRCIRQLVYSRMGVPPKPLPGRAVLVFDDGHWHEELTASWITKTAIRLHARQAPVDIPLPRPLGPAYSCPVCTARIPPDRLHGHIDGLLTDPLGVTRLLEHKSLNHFSFEDALQGNIPLDNLTQACTYLTGIQHQQPDVREALLLLKNKNTSAYLEYRFAYEAATDHCQLLELLASDGTSMPLTERFDGLVQSAIAKFIQTEDYATSKTLPPRPYRADHWRCSYCAWATRCWEHYAAEVAHREPLAQLDPTLGPLLAEYARAAKAKHEGEAITKRLRPKILGALEASHGKAGVADGYTASVNLQTRTSVDDTLLSPQVRRAAERTKTIEVLSVEPTRP
jgi:hypothetical protein